MKSKWKLSDEFIYSKNEDKIIFVPTSPKRVSEKICFAVENIGKEIIDLIAENYDETEIADKISEKYGVLKEDVCKDVEKFCGELYEKGILKNG